MKNSPGSLIALAALMVVLVTTAPGCLGLAGGNGVTAFPRAAVIPPRGLIYTHYRAPLTTDMKKTDFGSKKGVDYTRYLLVPLFGFGDVSIEKIAKDNNITTIKHVDYELTSVLMIFAEMKIIVYGD